MMSQEYVKKKSLEALNASGENRQEASQLLRVWAESDAELKTSLINPFLPNICALAIQSASAGAEDNTIMKKANENSLLSAIASSETLTMSSIRQPQSPPPRSSARHQKAIATLAAAFKQKQS
jgi:hypothetical protein